MQTAAAVVAEGGSSAISSTAVSTSGKATSPVAVR